MAEQPIAGSDLQQRYKQFLDLMPLTLALAGLPPSEGRLFGEEQIEARAITIRGSIPGGAEYGQGMPERVVRALRVGSGTGGGNACGVLFDRRWEADKNWRGGATEAGT